MKRFIWFMFGIVVFIVCFSANVMATDSSAISVTVTQAGCEGVTIEPTDGIFYLPSVVDIKELSFSFEGEISYRSLDEKTQGTLFSGDILDLTPFEAEDERGVCCYKLSLLWDDHTAVYTFYHDDILPTVFVSTSQGLSYIESSKENRDKGAQVLIVTSDAHIEYNDLEADTYSEIKGRGNATWSYYKKPYQLKLAEKTALLGMEKAKTWILLAGYTDQSALHNALAFTLGDALEIPYNIEYRFVNLYIDGAYRGLYMICEKVQVDESRVDIRDLEKANESANPDRELESFSIKTVTSGTLITESVLESYTYCEGMVSPEDVTGGYLVELDNIRGMSEPCRFQTENGNIYVVKSPEYASREEMEYIASLFADMEEAIYSSDGYNKKGIHYSEYIDMESFAGIYTLQELLKNWDAYLSSMFFFKDADLGDIRSKIYMGPLWDMDNTLGNINFNREYGTDTSYLWAQNGVFNSYPRDFAKSLMEHADFQEVVEQKFDEAYHEVRCYLAEGGGLERDVEAISDAVLMDRTRWKLYDADSWLLSASGRKSSVKFVQFEEYGIAQDTRRDTALGFFRYYLSERADALLLLIGSGTYEPLTEDTTQTTEILTTSEVISAETMHAEGGEVTVHESTASSGEHSAVTQEKPSLLGYILAGAVAVAMGIILSLVIIRKKRT